MNAGEKLLKGLELLNISNTDSSKIEEWADKLDKYIKEIILFNSAYNLTNTSDYDEITINHILDSLSAANTIKSFSETLAKENQQSSGEIKIADIGSGGGLPGIPLATCLSEQNFTLVERMDKRCAFLENEKAILGLQNVSVMQSEAEKVPEESFDIVTFRAFRPLDKKMIKTLLNLTKTGGIIAAYKAKTESITEEMNGIKNIVADYEIIPLEVPFLTGTNKKDSRERNLVIIRK